MVWNQDRALHAGYKKGDAIVAFTWPREGDVPGPKHHFGLIEDVRAHCLRLDVGKDGTFHELTWDRIKRVQPLPLRAIAKLLNGLPVEQQLLLLKEE